MKGLPQLDSHQNRICCEGDDEELAGWAGSCKESCPLVVLQRAMGREREVRKKKENERRVLCPPVEWSNT